MRCHAQALLDSSKACGRQTLRWQLIGAFDAATELMVVLLSAGLVWQLQMRLELKLRVILAFIFRIPWDISSSKDLFTALTYRRLIPVAIIHIKYIQSMPEDNQNLAVFAPLTGEIIELGYSLISATIPNLKSFIMSFDTAMMMSVSFKLSSTSRSQFPGGNPCDRIDCNSSKSNKCPTLFDHDGRNEFNSKLRPESEGIRYTSEIHHFDDWSLSNGDLSNAGPLRESQEGTIRRDVHWRVEQTYADI
jgi:hypothetical protein